MPKKKSSIISFTKLLSLSFIVIIIYSNSFSQVKVNSTVKKSKLLITNNSTNDSINNLKNKKFIDKINQADKKIKKGDSAKENTSIKANNQLNDSMTKLNAKNLLVQINRIDTSLKNLDSKLNNFTRVNGNDYEYGFALAVGAIAVSLILFWSFVKIKRKKYYYRTFFSVFKKHHLTFLIAVSFTLLILSGSLLFYYHQNSRIQREFFSSTGILFSILGTIITLFGTVIGFLVYRTLRPFHSSWPSLLSKINENLEELLNDILKKENYIYSDDFNLNEINDVKRNSLENYGKEYRVNILVYSPNPGQISAKDQNDLIYKLFLIYYRLLKTLIELNISIRILCLTNSSISRMINELIYEKPEEKDDKINNTIFFLNEMEKKYVEIWRTDKTPKTHFYLGGLKDYPDWYIRFLISRKVKEDRHSVRGYFIDDKDELNFISEVFEEHLKDVSCPILMEDAGNPYKQKLLFYSQSHVEELEIHWIFLKRNNNKYEEEELKGSTILKLRDNPNLSYLDNHKLQIQDGDIEDLFRRKQHLHFMQVEWNVELPNEITELPPSDYTFYFRGTLKKYSYQFPEVLLLCEKSTLWPKKIEIQKDEKNQIQFVFTEYI